MAKEFKLRHRIGTIRAFNVRTGHGVVVIGRKPVSFSATSFRVRSAPRYPKTGEAVDAVFSGDGKRLVSLWAKEA